MLFCCIFCLVFKSVIRFQFEWSWVDFCSFEWNVFLNFSTFQLWYAYQSTRNQVQASFKKLSLCFTKWHINYVNCMLVNFAKFRVEKPPYKFWQPQPKFLEFFSIQNPLSLRGFGEKSWKRKTPLQRNIYLVSLFLNFLTS